MKTVSNDFAAELRAAFAASGLSVHALTRKAKTPYANAYMFFVALQSKPNLNTVQRWSKALGLSMLQTVECEA